MEGVPDRDRLLALLEEAYLRFVRRRGGDYRWPAVIGGPVWYGEDGVFYELNRLLRERGFRELTWEEFKQLLDYIDRAKLWGRVRVDRILAPNGNVEPHNNILHAGLPEKPVEREIRVVLTIFGGEEAFVGTVLG